MMSQTAAGLDHDEVEPKRKVRERASVGQDTEITERERRPMESGALASVDGLLGEAEVTARPPPDFDNDERPGRTGVHREQVDLGASHANLPCEDSPAHRREVPGDLGLRRISGALGRGPHDLSLKASPYLSIN
jgi:hypothetical protein